VRYRLGGRFRGECGAALKAAACPRCGARHAAGAMYCQDCGRALRGRERKDLPARVPWILAGVSLVAFSLVIALLVQRGSVERRGDMVMTGGGPGAQPGSAAGVSGGMPSAEDLATMGPTEAADRLFDRAMMEHSTNPENAARFLEMGLRAYAAVPETDMDLDRWFHVGMLLLVSGDLAGAAETADGILAREPGHLLGLALAVRAADAGGAPDVAAAHRERLAAGTARGMPDRPEYQAHADLIWGTLSESPGGNGSDDSLDR